MGTGNDKKEAINEIITKEKKGRVVSTLREFKEFAVKGNIVDMAVGVIIGNAFSKIVTSLVNDIIMPFVSIITGKINFSSLYISLGEGKGDDEIKLNYGLFITNVVDFLIISFSIFIVIRQLKKIQLLRPKPSAEPNEKTCPYCFSSVNIKAVRCPYCTSDLVQNNIPDDKNDDTAGNS